jgi:hypothetical protein
VSCSPVEAPQPLSHGYFTSGGAAPMARTVSHSQQPHCFKCLVLPWQPLVATDRHVLLAVEESLASTTDLPLVLHTCQFFTDVMLRDFPAEIFLQRPAILKVTISGVLVLSVSKFRKEIFGLDYSVYCLCVNVYCTAATGCQPNCS